MSEKGQEPFHVYRDHDGRSPIHVIGLGLPGGGLPLGHPLVPRADVLVGGKAVLDALAGNPAEKMVGDSDTATLYARMEALRDQGKTLVVLCSGDPLFFGLGARLAERFGASSVRALPGISSLQAAASPAGLPWEGVRSVSLPGREAFPPLAGALTTREPVAGLCDR